jgi:hypothetical protein
MQGMSAYTLMPVNFYQLMEELELTLTAINELYGISRKIKPRSLCWPKRVRITEKLS